MLHQFRREPELALNTAEEARSLCLEYRFDYYGAWSALVRAWAIAEHGRLKEGVTAYDAALKEFQETGAGLRMPHHLGLLAAIHRKAGRGAVGLKLIAEAAQIARGTRRAGAIPSWNWNMANCFCFPIPTMRSRKPRRHFNVRPKFPLVRAQNCLNCGPM